VVADLLNRRHPLPHWLKRSARVDLLQLLAGVRPAIRTETVGFVEYVVIQRWARGFGWFVAFDDPFIALSPIPGLSRQILAIDRQPAPHTLRLGLALGYPLCCCRAAERVGENNLDDWSATMGRRAFFGRFKLINPSGYGEGLSLISHIPCSPYCAASLRLVNGVLQKFGRPPEPSRRNTVK
jgi:hypothetical protein